MKLTPAIPSGWRRLYSQETILPGDKFFDNIRNEWTETHIGRGKTVFQMDDIYIRKEDNMNITSDDAKIRICKVTAIDGGILKLERISDLAFFSYIPEKGGPGYSIGETYYFPVLNVPLQNQPAPPKTPSGYCKLSICSWCTPKSRQEHLKTFAAAHDILVSNGICEDCLLKLKLEIPNLNATA